MRREERPKAHELKAQMHIHVVNCFAQVFEWASNSIELIRAAFDWFDGRRFYDD